MRERFAAGPPPVRWNAYLTAARLRVVRGGALPYNPRNQPAQRPASEEIV